MSPAHALASPTAVIDSGGWSSGLTHDGTYIYNSLLGNNQVIRIDPTTNQIVATYQLPTLSQPYEMVVVDGFLYTANFWNSSNTAPGTVSRINLATGEVTAAWATMSNGFKAEWITSDGVEIFVSGSNGKVARIPISNPSSVTELAPAYGWTGDLAVTGNYLYIAGASNTNGGVIRIDLSDNSIDPQWALANTKIVGLALAGDYLYVGKLGSATVAKIQISDGSVLATSNALTSFPWILTVGGGVVYSSQLNGDVSTLDANDLTVLGNPFATPLAGNYIYDSIPFAGSLWVSSYYPNNKVYRYGLVNVPTLSPATQTPPAGTVGAPFSTSPITATNFTSQVTFSIYPALPAGLTFDPETGQISGTPTGSSPVTTYTITAIGTDFVTATVTFGIDGGASLPDTGSDSGLVSGATASALAMVALGAVLVARRVVRRART